MNYGRYNDVLYLFLPLCADIEENNIIVCCMIFKFLNSRGFLNFYFLSSNMSITI